MKLNKNKVLLGRATFGNKTTKVPGRTNNDKTNGNGEMISQLHSLKMNEFKGQVAIITGAASGIGLAISQKLLKEGAQVALLDINEDGLNNEFKKYKTKARL